MKSLKKINKTKKTVLIAVTSALLLIAGASSFYVLALGGNFFGWEVSRDADSPVNTEPPTSNQLDAGKQIKENTVNKEQEAITGSNNNITVSTSAIQDDDIDIVRIRAIIQTVTSSGTCGLAVSKGSIVITRQAEVQALSNYSTCKGFDIPTSEFSPGKWQVVVNFSSANKKGSGSSEVVIE